MQFLERYQRSAACCLPTDAFQQAMITTGHQRWLYLKDRTVSDMVSICLVYLSHYAPRIKPASLCRNLFILDYQSQLTALPYNLIILIFILIRQVPCFPLTIFSILEKQPQSQNQQLTISSTTNQSVSADVCVCACRARLVVFGRCNRLDFSALTALDNLSYSPGNLWDLPLHVKIWSSVLMFFCFFLWCCYFCYL